MDGLCMAYAGIVDRSTFKILQSCKVDDMKPMHKRVFSSV